MYKLAKKIRPFVGNFRAGKFIEKQLLKNVELINYIPIFIVGLPRSGSTLLYQLICSHFNVAFFSNFASLFFTYPVTMISITKCFQNEVKIKNFQSDFGFTKGLFSPSEAGGIYRYWFSEKNFVGDEHIKNTIFKISNIMQRPFVWKNLNLSIEVERLYNIFPQSLFIKIDRKLEYICQSIYLRLKSGKTIDIEGFEKSIFESSGDPLLDVAYTVKKYEANLNSVLNKLQPNLITLDYEKLCYDTFFMLQLIAQAYSRIGFKLEFNERDILQSFQPQEKVKLAADDWDKLMRELNNNNKVV